jgi:hypothetical protein
METVPSEMIFNLLKLNFPNASERDLVSLTQKVQNVSRPPRTRLDAPKFCFPKPQARSLE